jgi:selenocysteine lyase/cysteine desulfurase
MTELNIETIRSRFPIFNRKIYLNSCSQGALCDSVEAGIKEYVATWHDRGSPWDIWTEQYEAARVAFARFIGASPDEVAVVASASAAINAVASSFNFDHRKKVVMGELEFPTMGHIWLAQQPRGASVEFVPAADNRIPAAAYDRLIDDRTLIVPVTQVSFRNGFRSDLEAITRIAHRNGALVIVDSYQDCGTRPIDVKAMDVDFLVTGTLKYLLGPPGLAFLYAKEGLARELIPTASGWFGQTDPFAYNPKLFSPAPSARRFEAGTPPVPNIYAALPALGLLQETGLENIRDHIAGLARKMIDGALGLGIRVKTPPESVGPLIVLQCKDALAVVEALAQKDIVTSNRQDGLRVSFHVYNTSNDVDRVLEVLAENLDKMELEGR